MLQMILSAHVHTQPRSRERGGGTWRLCRPPFDATLNTGRCPATIRCRGAHTCAWRAISHVLPRNGSTPIIEVARSIPWGFDEYRTLRTNVALADFSAAASSLLPSYAKSAGAVAVVLHILVGEGVSRSKWRSAVAAAMRGGATEIWAMEHDREARCWENRSSWPTGHESNPPREQGSEMFTLEELREETLVLARLHCGGQQRLLASCRIPFTAKGASRNMLVGVQCYCMRRGRCLGGDAKSGLFCRAGSEEPESDTRARTLYRGIDYVYAFHADAPDDVRQFKDAISAIYSQDDLWDKPMIQATFASVIGSMSALNLLIDLPPTEEVVLFDINPWMVEYAVMLVEVIMSSRSRLHFVEKMLSRDVTGFLRSLGLDDLQPNISSDQVMGLPIQWRAASAVQEGLTSPSACSHAWLTSQIVRRNQMRPGRRRVCERILLFHEVSKPPRLDPAKVEKCNNFSGLSKRRQLDCSTKSNVCTLYYGAGWLASEDAFASVRHRLTTSRVRCARLPARHPLFPLVR